MRKDKAKALQHHCNALIAATRGQIADDTRHIVDIALINSNLAHVRYYVYLCKKNKEDV